MLTFFIYFLTAILILVCLLTVLIVLMQRPKQEGLGAAFGSGVTDQMWGAQTTNVLQRGTVYLAVLFFSITLILAVLVNAKQKGTAKTLDNLSKPADTSESKDLDTTPAIGAPPLAPSTTPSFDDIKINPDTTTPSLPEPVIEAPAVEGAETPAPEAAETPAPEAGDATSAAIEALIEEVEAVTEETP